jgi:purine-nucleoside phosphorylase
MENDVAACLEETVRAVQAVAERTPTIGVVLGTGLGGFVDRMRQVLSIPCSSLPHMAAPRSRHNEGNVCLGVVDDVPIVCLQGRIHLHDGCPPWQVVHGVRLMAALGVRAVLLTDACLPLDPTWQPDTMMAITDHLDLMSRDDSFRWPSEGRDVVSFATPYDAALTGELHEVAKSEMHLAERIGKPVQIVLHDGIYAAVRDRWCTTPAQLRLLRAHGADMVGMAIVPEVIALRQLGVRLAALACVSTGVVAAGDAAPQRALFERIVRAWVLRAHRSEA